MLETLINSGREAQRTGAWDEALAHYETALAMLPAEGDPRNAADLLRWIGIVHFQRGGLEEAGEKFAQSRSVAEEAGLSDSSTAALVSLANVELLRGNLELAADSYLQARDLAEDNGDDRLVALIDQNLGVIANIQGNVAVALLSYRSALERYRRLGDDRQALQALGNMAMAHVDLAE